jgi:hypothetical protein
MSLYTLKYFKKLIIKEKEIIENGEDPNSKNHINSGAIKIKFYMSYLLSNFFFLTHVSIL